MMRWDRLIMWTTFTIMMTFAPMAVSGLITVRWTATTALSGWARLGIAIAIAFIFMSPFLLRGPDSGLVGPMSHIFTYVTYFLFVCVFLFFCFMIARDVIWIILKSLSLPVPSPFQAAAVLKANVALLMIVVALAGYALYEGTRVPRLKEITLYSEKVTAPLKIAVLPDIHIHRALPRSKLQQMIDKTNAERPDVIALPGDIIDDRADTIADLVPLLADFQAPLGVYVVDGNHEIYIGTREAQSAFQATHLTYLYNESREIRPDVRIAGVPDIQSHRIGRPVDMKQALPKTKAYSVLLAHTPKMFDMTDNTADLQLSGHTHGGQIFPFHLLAWLSNKYLSGLFRHHNRYLYVSRGAGQWGPQMRLFAPSEITMITVLPK